MEPFECWPAPHAQGLGTMDPGPLLLPTPKGSQNLKKADAGVLAEEYWWPQCLVTHQGPLGFAMDFPNVLRKASEKKCQKPRFLSPFQMVIEDEESSEE